MKVDAALFVREDIEKLGVAPLTSMFLYGEEKQRRFDDFRPEVHDSDGLIIVNGDLGPNLPWAHGVPLGSGDFHLFGLRDLGLRRLPAQFRRAFDGRIQKDPERWGFEHYRVDGVLSLAPNRGGTFPVNVDGSTYPCRDAASFRIVDQVNLMAATRRPGA